MFQHIRMIFEWSCDTEHWEVKGINYIFKYIKIENSFVKCICTVLK